VTVDGGEPVEMHGINWFGCAGQGGCTRGRRRRDATKGLGGGVSRAAFPPAEPSFTPRSFNNGMTWLNGLWAGGKSGNSDFATIAYQLQLLVRRRAACARPCHGRRCRGGS
jgi:hypothetical protein